jgi:Protein of unknown function (DUF3106)
MPWPNQLTLLPPKPIATALLAATLLWLGLCGISALAQVPAPAVPASASVASEAQAQARPASAAAPAASRALATKATSSAARSNNNRQVTKPLWTELTPAQQQALAPLAGKWDTVSEAQKRKWLALSQNFPRMSGAEQAKLHSRMSEWAALSPQQRTQARLNFGETQQLSADDKKAKWEAYQALPPEEKSKLAASAAKPPATAAAVKPVPPQKLAGVPQPKPAAAAVKPAPTEKLADAPKPKRAAKTPRIAAGPGQVDGNTLLPQPAPKRAPDPAN